MSAIKCRFDGLGTQERLACGVAAAGVLVLSGTCLRRWQWRSRQAASQKKAVKLAADADLLRVGFSTKKLPTDIDHVIVGSGLSGLYLAALLSKIGRRVVVLEQHYVAGGCTHTFKDKGFEFDTGVHYMGMATQFTAFMDFAGQGRFRMTRQGEDDGSEVYNELHLNNQCAHRFRPGPKTFARDLVDKFPHQELAIHRFLAEVDRAGAAAPLVGVKYFMPSSVFGVLLRLPGPVRWLATRYIRRTLSEALTDCGVTDPTLRAIFCAEFGDHGMVPDDCPFFVHAGILSHFFAEGGFSPVGGSDSFAQSLVPAIFEAGGAVLVRAPVHRIVEESGRAVGVEMAGGKGVVRARRSVISAAGVEVTYRKLLDDVAVAKAGGPPASLIESERGNISQHIYGFVGFEGDAKELALPTYNVWSMPPPGPEPCTDLNAIWRSLFGKGTDKPAFLASDEAAKAAQVPAFISFPSAKDVTYQERCPGKHSAVVITEARGDYFGPCGAHTKRPEEYSVIKQRYQQLVLNAVTRHFPHLKDKVAYVDVGTPASNEYYLGRAASYGLNQTASRFLDTSLRITVPGLRGLYLTGQDILMGGVFPQVISAWLTFASMLGPLSVDLWLLLSDFALFVGRRSLFDGTYVSKLP